MYIEVDRILQGMLRYLSVTINSYQILANLISFTVSLPFQPPFYSFLKEIPKKMSFLDAEKGLENYPSVHLAFSLLDVPVSISLTAKLHLVPGISSRCQWLIHSLEFGCSAVTD